jgi:hypothetical protein
MAGLIAGLAIRAELIKKKMKRLGATSEETARKPEELQVEERLLKNNVARVRGIKRTKDGRYYVECKDMEHC